MKSNHNNSNILGFYYLIEKMKFTRLMLCISISIFFAVFIRLPALGQSTFPYSNSLDGSNQANITLAGDAAFVTGSDPTNKYVQLTPYANNKAGFIFFNNASFASYQGIHIEFEYAMQGASYDGTQGADGLSFFLYDANQNINTASLPPRRSARIYPKSYK